MFINKLLLGGILTCLSIPSFAQIQITPEAGVSFYNEGLSNNKAIVSPRIGVGVDYFFNQQKNGWGLMSGLYFYQKKEAYTTIWGTYRGKEGYDIDFPTSAYDQLKPTDDMVLRKVTTDDTYTRRDYLQLPIMVKYKWQINDTYALSAAAGGYVAVGVGGKHQIDEFIYSVEEKIRNTTVSSTARMTCWHLTASMPVSVLACLFMPIVYRLILITRPICIGAT